MQLNVKNSEPMKYKLYNITLQNNISLSTYSYDNCTTTRINCGFIYQHFHALPPPFRPHSMWALLPSPSPLAFFTNMYFHGTHGPGCGPPSGPLRNLLHPISGECHHVSMVAMSTLHTSIPPNDASFPFPVLLFKVIITSPNLNSGSSGFSSGQGSGISGNCCACFPLSNCVT